MPQVEQTIHLGPVPAQSSGQFTTPNALREHGLVNRKFCPFQRRGSDDVLAASWLAGQGQRSTTLDIEGQRRFQCIDGLFQSCFGTFAMSDGFRYVREADQEPTAITHQFHWVIES